MNQCCICQTHITDIMTYGYAPYPTMCRDCWLNQREIEVRYPSEPPTLEMRKKLKTIDAEIAEAEADIEALEEDLMRADTKLRELKLSKFILEMTWKQIKQ